MTTTTEELRGVRGFNRIARQLNTWDEEPRKAPRPKNYDRIERKIALREARKARSFIKFGDGITMLVQPK